ncbi:MAG: phosphoglucosamine mutase [Pseudomonadota bacterium]
MTRKYFGTDGIRGLVNSGYMTPDVAMRMGMAAGKHFTRGVHVHRVVIGKDTRRSGYMFEAALTAGFVASGMDVMLVGPMPTPGIAMLVKSLRADLGVMISASHNPFHDNGIKFFGPDGYKLSDDIEAEIESLMDGDLSDCWAAADKTGQRRLLEDATGRYIEVAKSTVPPGFTLDGLKVVIDCAHGAAYRVAPPVLWELGADSIAMGVSPNGYNINDGVGSTAPEAMCERVVKEGAHIGIALDGDADRLILCDENGKIIDGDQIMSLIARSWHKRNLLRGGGLVATVMSNMGLERILAKDGLRLERTQVGDRYVVERMRSGGFNVGGEQSGHLILSDYATTGDGLIAALQVLVELAQSGLSTSEACNQFQPMPQVLKNARYTGTAPLERENVKQALAAGEKLLNTNGRIVVRASGTEPVIRVMAEGEDPSQVESVVDSIKAEIERAA